ncbi:DeoR/GlpR family DNA-binding transcription regulator [Aestuariispira ectoiniformans]|uniref:DeoR/GlpR family DNA-binding transcription regulator n=1 Tax=Aestuariispira ectoiniformans TaxID=2775080 RepID=UPI00223B1F0C|nr:DeoR/GlpR family DNA-binding transcription regulator [Aestuariispira ectoiniformans]
MTPQDRRDAIVKYVTENGATALSFLADHFAVSVQSIRNDVRQLTEEGLLFRRHGDVAPPPFRDNIGYDQRGIWNLSGKIHIAELAAGLLPDNCSISLGTGTTVEQVALHLRNHQNLDILTNNLHIVVPLCSWDNCNLLLAGGHVRKRDQDIIGADALDFFSRYRCDFSIVSVGGLGEDGALYDFNDDEVHSRRGQFDHSNTRILVVDSRKFDRRALCQNGTVADFDYLICDRKPPQAVLDCAAKGGTITLFP